MKYFSLTVINQIKSASNEKVVEEVINNSLQRLRVKNVNGHIIQRFITGLELALNRQRFEQHTTKTLENMSSAVDILRRLQKPLI